MLIFLSNILQLSFLGLTSQHFTLISLCHNRHSQLLWTRILIRGILRNGITITMDYNMGLLISRCRIATSQCRTNMYLFSIFHQINNILFQVNKRCQVKQCMFKLRLSNLDKIANMVKALLLVLLRVSHLHLLLLTPKVLRSNQEIWVTDYFQIFTYQRGFGVLGGVLMQFV